MKPILKKIAFAAAAAFSCGAVMACEVPVSAPNNLVFIIQRHGGYQVSDAQCEMLQKRGLALDVDGDATVLSGINVAWASVHIMKVNGRTSGTSGISTMVDTHPGSQDLADDVFYDALGRALRNLDWRLAVQQVTRAGN
ncbi:hypothetical protein [Burkholderia sp. Ac-20365]|uniref:hypothetical protein n=1 Tax=Burkholderia sp. Ac-20365 TaxID=2703897 RepID=UPI00197C2F1F|nr:hypothetical protein [Burkholderia sp. Ac-20365]MBN3761006.1 hypothetical protein [Burkholderia sp. Ac-20365]